MQALTLRAVASRLGVSYSTAFALVKQRKVRAFRAGTRGGWRVDANDLETFIESRKTELAEPLPRAAVDPDAQFDQTDSPFL